MTDKIKLYGLNLSNFAQNNPIFKYYDSYTSLKEALEALKIAEMAKAYIQDAQKFGAKGLDGLSLVNSIVKQFSDTILSTFDTSFSALYVAPQRGGLVSYMNTYKMHLQDKIDPNRPFDNGGACYVNLMFLVSMIDISVAKQKVDNIKTLFNIAQKGKTDALKALTGYSDFDEIKNEFWNYYQRKEKIGSHAEITGAWQKVSVADMMPEAAINTFYDYFNKLSSYQPSDDSKFKLANKVEAQWNKLIAVVDDLIIITDAVLKLILDTQVVTIICPPITGTPTEKTPYVTPAIDNLVRYVNTIPEQISSKNYELISGEDVSNSDFSSMVERNYFVGGYNIVFKTGSLSTTATQLDTLLSLFGIPAINFDSSVTPDFLTNI